MREGGANAHPEVARRTAPLSAHVILSSPKVRNLLNCHDGEDGLRHFQTIRAMMHTADKYLYSDTHPTVALRGQVNEVAGGKAVNFALTTIDPEMVTSAACAPLPLLVSERPQRMQCQPVSRKRD